MHNVGVYPILYVTIVLYYFTVMSFEEELEEIDRQEWLSLFDDKQIMQITKVFLDWLYDLPDDYIPTQQIKYFK